MLRSIAVAVTTADVGARASIWAVVAGLILGAVLVGHVAYRVFRSLPDATQQAAVAAVRGRPRLVSVAAAAAAWTILYALYSLAYPATTVTP